VALGQYCACGPTLTADTNMGPVSIVGSSGTSIQETSNCPGTVGPRNFTALQVKLVRGRNYLLTYTVSTCGGQYTSLSGAWIDWNRNQNYEDGEKLGDFIGGVMGAVNRSFTVPTTAEPGATGFRVQVQETTSQTLNPCQLFAYGGTKDFTAVVLTSGGGGGGGEGSGSSSDGGLSGGSIFLILLLVFIVVYIVGGCVFMRTKRGTTGCKESCPNGEFWGNFCGLVKDGCLFTKAKMFRSGEYRSLSGGDKVDRDEL